MSKSIKDEYTQSEGAKPALHSVTIRSVLTAVAAVVLEHVVSASPAIAMLIFTVLPAWLQNLVTLEAIQVGLESILVAIAGWAGVRVVKERVKQGDISGVIKVKQ